MISALSPLPGSIHGWECRSKSERLPDAEKERAGLLSWAGGRASEPPARTAVQDRQQGRDAQNHYRSTDDAPAIRNQAHNCTLQHLQLSRVPA